MIQIRRDLFETNSSSIHSMTMCTEVDWLNWQKGSLLYDWDNKEFVSQQVAEKENRIPEYLLSSPDEFFNEAESYGYETFKDSFRGIIAFGYYGHD